MMLLKGEFTSNTDWYEELMCCGIPNSAEVIEALESLFNHRAWFVVVRKEPVILFCGVV